MSVPKCTICGSKRWLWKDVVEPWYNCPQCGVVCNQCDKRSGFLGTGPKKCKKCDSTLTPMKK
jgi:hypothetical protein